MDKLNILLAEIQNNLKQMINYEIENIKFWNDREIFLNDLYKFAKNILGYQKMTDTIHKKWAENLQEKSIKRRLRLKPRGTFKTSLYTISYPIWRLMQNKELRIAICGSSLENAIMNLQNIKKHFIYNDTFIKYFGNFYDKDQTWTESSFSIAGNLNLNKKENNITAIGFGSQITGKHFDLMIVDDLVNNEDRESYTIRKKKQRWFEDLISVLEPDGEILIIGTRWHFDDFYNYLITEINPRLPALEKYDIEIESAINEKGEANFPEILSLEKLNSLKIEKGSIEFNSQYLNSPIAEGTQIFSESDFCYFENYKSKNVLAYLDPSMGKNIESDYSALIIGEVDTEKFLNIIDAVIVKILPDKLIDLIIYNCEKYSVRILGIESNSFQEYFVNDIAKKISHLNVKVEKILHHTSKEIRIQSIQPAIKNGTIKFCKDMKSKYKLLSEQLLNYPLAKNDDGPDALEGLYSLYRKHIQKAVIINSDLMKNFGVKNNVMD